MSKMSLIPQNFIQIVLNQIRILKCSEAISLGNFHLLRVFLPIGRSGLITQLFFLHKWDRQLQKSLLSQALLYNVPSLSFLPSTDRQSSSRVVYTALHQMIQCSREWESVQSGSLVGWAFLINLGFKVSTSTLFQANKSQHQFCTLL